MNRLLPIGLLLLLALAACVKAVEPVETPVIELSSIDSLMWQRPDSVGRVDLRLIRC